MNVPVVDWRFRLFGLSAFALALAFGALFSTLAAAIALTAALVLAACSWLTTHARWLRIVWYGGLLLGAGVMYVSAPTLQIGGAVSSCEEIPTVLDAGGNAEHAGAIATSQEQHSSPARQHDSLVSEASYQVVLEPNHVSYEERVDLHLRRGYFVHLDLTELGAQLAHLGPDTQIMVGGDGMVAATFVPNELAGTIGLSTRPSSVWIETRTRVRPGAVHACAGATLMPFQKVRLAWPQPLDTRIDGLVQGSDNTAPVAISASVDKQLPHSFEVLLPRNALFSQHPVQLRPTRTARTDDSVTDRFEPASAAIHVDALSMIAELLPENRIVRSQWVYERIHWLLPPTWPVTLLYLLVASALGDAGMRRPRD